MRLLHIFYVCFWFSILSSSAQAQILVAPSTDEDGNYVVALSGLWGAPLSTCNYWGPAQRLDEISPTGTAKSYWGYYRTETEWDMVGKLAGIYKYTAEIKICQLTGYGASLQTIVTPQVHVNVNGTQVIRPAASGEILFFYDALGRLTGRSDALNPKQVYVYDKAGNRKIIVANP